MKLIDKDALIAEIERRKIPFKRDVEDGNYPTYLCALMDFEDFIDTLEVKEVDLDKELNKYFITNNLIAADIQIEPVTQMKKCAKHFFELGLNTQHSSINIPNIDDVLKENGVNPYSKEAKIIKESYYVTIEKLTQKGEEV